MVAEMPSEMLIMKIGMLEEQFRKLEKVVSRYDSQTSIPFNGNNDSMQQQHTLMRDLECFNMETIDEKLRLHSQVRALED